MTLAKIKYLSNTYFKFDFVKCAGWNRRAGGNFFSKSINVQTKIRPCRGDFFLKINKRACTSIRYTRVLSLLFLGMFINEIALTQNKCSEVLNFSHQMTAKSILRIIRHFFYNCAKFLPIQYFLWSMFSFSKISLTNFEPLILETQ